MDLTRRIDLVGYLHVGYGLGLLTLSLLMIVTVTIGAVVLPVFASWAAGLGAGISASLVLLAVAFPSMLAGVLLIRRFRWSRAMVMGLSVLDLFSFPVGTALGVFSLWILLKERARLEFV